MCVLFHVLNSCFVCHRFIVSTNNWIQRWWWRRFTATSTNENHKNKTATEKNAEKNETEQLRMEEPNSDTLHGKRARGPSPATRVYTIQHYCHFVYTLFYQSPHSIIWIYIWIHVVRLIFCVCFPFIHSFHCCPSSLALPSAMFAYTVVFAYRPRPLDSTEIWIHVWFSFRRSLFSGRQKTRTIGVRHATAQTNSSYVFMAFRS